MVRNKKSVTKLLKQPTNTNLKTEKNNGNEKVNKSGERKKTRKENLLQKYSKEILKQRMQVTASYMVSCKIIAIRNKFRIQDANGRIRNK